MRVAYADPAYPGTAHRYGRSEVNHERLIKVLMRFDGWALSTTSRSLRTLLPMCPEEVRVGAWVKPIGSGWGVSPMFAWEPVLFVSARPKDKDRRGDRHPPFDWVKAQNFQAATGFLGAKPPEFCGWLFDILGLKPEDDFLDLFHGSGAVKRAWNQWRACEMARGPLFSQGSMEEAVNG